MSKRLNQVKKELLLAIKEKEMQLAKLKLHIDKSSVCGDLYNKLVLEKAILKKELEDSQKSNVIDGIKKFIPHKKTLICDYFRK